MKISIFGHDVAAQENLRMVVPIATTMGHDVRTVFGNNNLTRNLEPLTGWEPDVVLTGMASTEPQGDLAMGTLAKNLGKPWVVLADTWFSGFRQAARSSIGDAVLLTASNEELARAKQFGYRDAKFLGGPPKWQTIAGELQVDVRQEYDVPADQKIFLVSGGKNQVVVTKMLEAVEKACRTLLQDNFKIIFKPHPKEGEDRDDTRRAAALASLKDNLIATQARSQVALMDSSDCVISSPGGGATTEAIYRRRPNIWWENPKALERFIEMTDGDSWPPLDAEATLRAGVPISERLLDIHDAIAMMLSPEGAASMRRKQEEAFPVVAPQEIERKIVSFLENL